jgi:hypothetical protein
MWLFAGKWHYMADGHRVSYSLVNNTAPDFTIPRQYTVEGLFSDTGMMEPAGPVHEASIRHFMSLCMKLVYEKEQVIQVRFCALFLKVIFEAWVTLQSTVFAKGTRQKTAWLEQF